MALPALPGMARLTSISAQGAIHEQHLLNGRGRGGGQKCQNLIKEMYQRAKYNVSQYLTIANLEDW